MDVFFGDRLEILHAAVPGRVRLSVPNLKHNPELAARLEHRLRTREAIQAVAASSATGNVTLTSRPSLEVDLIVQLVEWARGLTDDVFFGTHRNESWWASGIETVLASLGTSDDGLTINEAHERVKNFGSNSQPDNTTGSEWQILLRQFNSLPVWLLGTSAVISFVSGGLIDAALIAGVVAANATIGFLTDRRAERILREFIDHDRSWVMVRRNGASVEVAAEELVPGDIVLLPTGSIMAADARILSSVDLQVDESMLTGESLPASKSRAVLPPSVPLADRTNMLYAGTVVVSGSAVAVVVAIGSATETGRIQALVASTAPTETPIQRQLNRLGTQLTFASIAASGLVFGLGVLRGVPFATLMRTTTALAVAAIPEGLPTVATSILATGLREMRRNDVLVRQLAAVETLGAVSVICFDKTGTLTQNRMTAMQISTLEECFDIRDGSFFHQEDTVNLNDNGVLVRLLLVSVLCNDAEIQYSGGGSNQVLNGSSTENALIVVALANGINVADVRLSYPMLERTPRSDLRRYMITVHESENCNLLVAAKGSPIDLLALCTHAQLSDGRVASLTESDREHILHRNEIMTTCGLRVLGFASFEHPHEQTSPPDHLIWLGMIGMADPVRPGITAVLRDFHGAGIRTVMVTGDQAGTASAIAREVRLSPTTRAIDGFTFLQLSSEEISRTAQQYDVFSRVSPGNKLDIVQALQKGGLTVAMTGDGTNDAPALRAADIGIAMGRHGTRAAREIADVVLAEDDLSTMVVAVRQGRMIYANMRKAIHFLVGTNSSEVFVTIGATAFGLGQPLNAGQLLWLNLVTDVAVAYSLGFEPVEYDVMQRPPRPRDENIVRRSDYPRLALKSGLFSISALSAHLYGMARYGATGGGIAFSTLIGAQLLDGLSSRSETRAPWSLPENRALTIAILGTAALQGLVSAMPFSRRLLGLAAFDLLDLGVIAAGSALPFLIVETMIKPNAADSPVPPS